MKRIFFAVLTCTLLLSTGCKDPRDKTVWDYIDGGSANEADFQEGVEMLHQDLIKHGYMKEHSCILLDCSSNHQSTRADIERINNIVE